MANRGGINELKTGHPEPSEGPFPSQNSRQEVLLVLR
jgi:hypothetical protein